MQSSSGPMLSSSDNRCSKPCIKGHLIKTKAITTQYIMKIFTQISLVLFTLFAGLHSVNAQMNLQYADTLRQVLEQCQLDEDMNGAAAAVVFSDGSVWSGSSGKYGTSTLNTDLLYDIGSNTKSMVAALILLLEEEGSLSIEDTLYQFIAPVQNVPNGITLKQLMNHRSGVFSYTSHPNFANTVFNDETRFLHPDTILANFVSAPEFNAGSSWEYSNTNYILLGKVIEAVEQKPLNEAFKARLFEPFGLQNTYLDQYDSYTQTKTGSWISANNYYGDNFISFMSSAWAAGGVVATPEDFAHWAHKLGRGDILSDSSMVKMRTGTALSGGATYGLGMFERQINGKTFLGHGGTTLQNSEMEYSLEDDFSVVVMNIDDGFYAEARRMQLKLIALAEFIEENHVEDTATSISETVTQKIEVSTFPNPSNAQMTIQLEASASLGALRLEIRDITGRIVHQQAMISETMTLYKSDIGGGVYFASLYSNKGLVDSKRIIFH